MSSKLLEHIDTLHEALNNKLASTDDYATIQNTIKKAIKRLEQIDVKTGGDYILLKWGSLKGWDLKSEKGKALSKEYIEHGRSLSAMAQEDDARQKEIILEMIDGCNGTIRNDWDGNYYTKQEAKDYINEYGS